MKSAFHHIERIILHDPGGRGVAALAKPGSLEAACRVLAGAKRIGIVTGFFIPSAGACETDGPLGATHLASALQDSAELVVCTDDRCLSAVRSLISGAVADTSSLDDCDVLVSIERPGRAADGRYYTMRGVDLTDYVAPLDELFLNPKSGTTTVGVGDGGNEIGMGIVRDAVRRSIPLGETIGCIVPVDLLVVCGVSNWGAWGLAAGMGLLRKTRPLPTPEQALADLNTLVAAGAVDGVTGANEPSVDGLDWAVHTEVLRRLKAAVES